MLLGISVLTSTLHIVYRMSGSSRLNYPAQALALEAQGNDTL